MMQSRKLLIGEKYKHIYKKENIIYVPNNPNVDPRLSGHIDLSIYYDGFDTIIAENYLKNFIFPKKTIYLDLFQSSEYPNDIQLNICNVGNFVILNEKFVPNIILDYLTQRGKSIISVNQGYANCCTLTIDDKNIITSDEGIYNSVKKYNINALLIQQGYFDLDGFPYGFIGGSAFHLNDNIIAFTGNIDIHPDKKEILNFINKNDHTAIYLTNKNAFDIGGAIEI